MTKAKNPSNLIIFVPILFIVLTASFITLIHIKQADDKFVSDYERLSTKLIKEERLRVDTVLDSINSYITFKKESSINILKNKIQSRVLIADKMLNTIYNNNIGILPKSSIQISLLSSLSKIKSEDNGKYFIYGTNSLSQQSISNVSDSNLFNQINELLKISNDGFVFFTENHNNKDEHYIAYIKRFELSNFVIGYKESIYSFEEEIKSDVLERLSLMEFDGSIYTLNSNLEIIQHSSNYNLVSKKINVYEKDKNILYLLKEYLKFSKLDLVESKKNKYYWKKLDENNYKIVSFNYIKDWEWIIAIDANIHNIRDNIIEIIGIKENLRDETIYSSIKTAIIFIIIASIISYFISDYINSVIRVYRRNIERQKVVLKHLNSSLETKVEEKTMQLQELNKRIADKFKIEVKKNKEKDQLLSEQSKHVLMGEMIGNIAHQWRQPLSTITTIASGNTIKIDYDVFDKDELKKDFESIVETAQYLSHTVDDFRNFFIENKSIEKFDILDVLDRNLNLLSTTIISNQINIVKNFNSVEIESIKNELLQALLNIINNAKDAVISHDKSSRIIVVDIYENNNTAIIEIKDSGGGIKKEIMDKIFEQYFTTKTDKSGTGLGLYMTKQIIEESLNGRLEVKNEEFVLDEQIYFGACFKIILPIQI